VRGSFEAGALRHQRFSKACTRLQRIDYSTASSHNTILTDLTLVTHNRASTLVQHLFTTDRTPKQRKEFN
jgi:hypothetical protein